jgi:hypothetical protein
MVGVRSITTDKSTSAAIMARSRGSSARTPSTTSMMLAPGWRFRISNTAVRPFGEAGIAQVLHRVFDFGDIAEAHRRALRR